MGTGQARCCGVATEREDFINFVSIKSFNGRWESFFRFYGCFIKR